MGKVIFITVMLLGSIESFATSEISDETVSETEVSAVIPPALLQQVEAGNAESAYFIANAFADGVMGIEKNLEQARQWFLKSAEMGYVHGMFEIGNMLYVEKDFAAAKDWFSKAADAGHGESLYRLSTYHIYSIDDETFDCKKAYELLTQAELRDVKSAYNDHAWMLSTLPDVNCRNGQKAWKIFADLQSLYAPSEHVPWAYLDTKAAVLAEISDFNEAIEIQSWIVEDFCDINLADDEANFKQSVDEFTEHFNQSDDGLCLGAIKRLQSYVNRKPWREAPEFNIN